MDGIENEFRIRTMQTELIEENSALRAKNGRLKAALEIIAGKRQCLDNLMSDKDIARAALADQGKG